MVPIERLHAMAPSMKLHDIVLLSTNFPYHFHGLFAMLQPSYAPAWGCMEHKARTKQENNSRGEIRFALNYRVSI